MSSLKVARPRHLDLNPKRVSFETPSDKRQSSPILTPPPKKIRLDTVIRPRRRRTHSCSFIGDRKRRVVIPTKFLLGGTINDPLNLEALGTEEIITKEVEPLNRGGVTVKVIIPPNINDPLNLDACSEDGEEQLADAIYRQRRRRKCRKQRKRRNSEPTSVNVPSVKDEKSSSVDENLSKIGLQTSTPEDLSGTMRPGAVIRQLSCPAVPDKNKCPCPLPDKNKVSQPATTSHSKSASIKRWRPCDRIVSPVIKQPGVGLRHYQLQQKQPPDKSQEINSPKSYHRKNEFYQYGNYSQYYGYRNPENAVDPRLKYFQRVWFEGKDVLDIGCNIGHISFIVARDFLARKVVGIDIDKKLINIANKNFKHYMPDGVLEETKFPKSMRMLYGPLKPAANKDGVCVFPHNVRFYQNNYVLQAEELIDTIREDYDCILCLSVTKWVHLNFGDVGLKLFFTRIYKNLRPNGILILEPQAWPSYKKKRKLTPKIFETYKSIQFYPNEFEEYLSKHLGFFHVHTYRVDHTFSRGFHRSLCIFRKPDELERKIPSKACTLDKGSQTDEHPAAELASISEVVKGSEHLNISSPTAGQSGNHSPESTSSKSSLVCSTEELVIDTAEESKNKSPVTVLSELSFIPVNNSEGIPDTVLSEILESTQQTVKNHDKSTHECEPETHLKMQCLVNNSDPSVETINNSTSTQCSTTINSIPVPNECVDSATGDNTTDEVDKFDLLTKSPLSDNSDINPPANKL